MNLRTQRSRSKNAFTLAEVMVSVAIGAFILSGAFAFLNGTGRALAGVTTQTVLNQEAGNAIEFIQSRIRFATKITNDTAGNALSLAFDDNYAVDSDGNGTPYDDKDHWERFQFVGVNSTNTSGCASNKLIYYSNINSTNSKVLVPSGMRNLPGYNIFLVTNQVLVVMRFGIVDTYTRDYYEAIDVQATGASLNRPIQTNILQILP